jgi:hypothetical protein
MHRVRNLQVVAEDHLRDLADVRGLEIEARFLRSAAGLRLGRNDVHEAIGAGERLGDGRRAGIGRRLDGDRDGRFRDGSRNRVSAAQARGNSEQAPARKGTRRAVAVALDFIAF